MFVGIGLAIVGVFGLWWAVTRYSGSSSLERSHAELAKRRDAYMKARWTRPVLRGEPIEGNATEAERAAVASLGAMDDKAFEHFKDVATTGVPPELSALIAPNADALRALRDATQRTYAYTTIPIEQWPTTKLPLYTGHFKAWKLLLAQAAMASPPECMLICADVIRMGQDTGPGAGLVGMMVGGVTYDQAAPIALACARKADASARAAFSRELEALVKNAPPVGPSLELETLGIAYGFETLANQAPAFPKDKEGLDLFVHRRTTIDALEIFLADDTKWDDVRADKYPDAFALVRARDEKLAQSGNVLVELAATGHVRYVERDAKAQAMVRALAVAVAAIPDGPNGAFAQAALQNAAFRDPFTGKPFDTVIGDKEWKVRSLGADGVDGGGSKESDDVVLTVPTL
jgi:hypothetical protein